MTKSAYAVRAALDDVAFSPDGTLVAAADTTAGGFRLWDVPSGTCLRGLHAPHLVHYLRFSPDGRSIACLTAEAYTDLPVTIWDVRTGQLLTGFP